MKKRITNWRVGFRILLLTGFIAIIWAVTAGNAAAAEIAAAAESAVPAGIVSVMDYGAARDGNTDDTQAIQAAVSSGETIFFPAGSYRISQPIVITGKRCWSLYAQEASFVYSGDDYAFRINAAENCHIEIGAIYSENGGGIAFYADDPWGWNQYVNLSFNYIECATDCIYVEVSAGWCNENQIYGGRFAGGLNGVRINYLGGDVLNGWNFYNCGIEGVDTGFFFDAGYGYLSDLTVINSRYAESYQTLLKTAGRVCDCLWIGTNVVEPERIICSPETDRFEMLAPIGEKGHRGCIINGKLMVEKTEYEEVVQ